MSKIKCQQAARMHTLRWLLFVICLQSISFKYESQSLVGNLKMEIILLEKCLCLREGFAAALMEGILLWESQILKGELLN